MTRDRRLEPGPVTLTGRAWSGHGPIERVEVSTDGGAVFAEAALDPPLGPHAWRGFRFDWDAEPGEHELCSRATDSAGNTQPLEPPWNLKGFANNAVTRIKVLVAT
jgi:Mo-co oxidoreductase dimerisation domain